MGERFFEHSMSNNEYSYRPWFSGRTARDELGCQSNVPGDQAARSESPSFWYLSFRHPHPPLLPVQDYIDLYRDMGVEIDMPFKGSWTDAQDPCFSLQVDFDRGSKMTPEQIRGARLAFYALCTQIDHQLRLIIGTLRERICWMIRSSVLPRIMETCWEIMACGPNGYSSKTQHIPMLLMGVKGDERVGHHRIDDRLVGWQDVMPTLLDLAGIDIPETVDGISMVGDKKREFFYGEIDEGPRATRMIHDDGSS